MTPAEVGALRHGLYRLHWKSGGASLASVGSLYNGDRWFACTNWTASSWHGIASTQWELVAVAELLPVKEPAPQRRHAVTPGGSTSIQALVREDLVQREAAGVATYGRPLRAFNGRDALLDAYEEALDLSCYLKQAMVERDAKAPSASPMNVLQRALIALESTPDPSANDLALIAEVRTLEENLRLSGYFSRPERAGAQGAADLDILSEEHL